MWRSPPARSALQNFFSKRPNRRMPDVVCKHSRSFAPPSLRSQGGPGMILHGSKSVPHRASFFALLSRRSPAKADAFSRGGVFAFHPAALPEYCSSFVILAPSRPLCSHLSESF
jgi:hypothetical protein